MVHDGEESLWPELPAAFQHRMSIRWLTFESLRILMQRRAAQGVSATVLLLTAMGPVQGELSDLQSTYEASVDPNMPQLDTASATAHLRMKLWTLYAKVDDELEPSDGAPLLRLRNAVVGFGAQSIKMPELALFASDVIGFGLSETAM